VRQDSHFGNTTSMVPFWHCISGHRTFFNLTKTEEQTLFGPQKTKNQRSLSGEPKDVPTGEMEAHNMVTFEVPKIPHTPSQSTPRCTSTGNCSPECHRHFCPVLGRSRQPHSFRPRPQRRLSTATRPTRQPLGPRSCGHSTGWRRMELKGIYCGKSLISKSTHPGKE
jgi:hypothetical protein